MTDPSALVHCDRGYIQLADPDHSYVHCPITWISAGQQLAVGEGALLRIYSLDGELLREIEALGGEPIGEAAHSPCGRRIAVATDGDEIDRHRVALVDIGSDEPLELDAEHDARIDALCWSPTGETLASVGDDLMLWEAKTGRLLRRCWGDVPLRFSQDGLRIARVHDDSFEVLGLDDAAEDRRLPRRSSWVHAWCWWDVSAPPPSSALDMHSDGPRTLALWGMGELPPFGRSLMWAPDRPLAIAEGDRHSMLLFRPGEDSPNVLTPFHDRTVNAITWSTDGAWIASGGRDRRVLLWSRDGELIGERAPAPDDEPARPSLRGRILGLHWSPTGSHLAIREHGGIRIWSVGLGS